MLRFQRARFLQIREMIVDLQKIALEIDEVGCLVLKD